MPAEAPQHAIDRIRRKADKARGIGMSVSVSGADLAALLGAYDQARVEVAEANGVKPKSPRKPKPPRPADADSTALVLLDVADDILEQHPGLWGQSLAAAIPAWMTDTQRELPDGWEALVGAD